MLKKHLLVICAFIFYANAEYISIDKIDKSKKSLQVSSCETRECIVVTHRQISAYDYITVSENGYFATYIVNLEAKDEEKVMSSLKDRFPDMILRKRYVDDKELYSLKAYDEDFFLHQNFKTKVKTKSIPIYAKPIHTSKIINKKYLGDSIDIDGCNEFEWCKEKDKKAYLPFYQIELEEKIDDNITKTEIIVPKKEVKEKETLPEGFVDKYKYALELFKSKKYEESYKILNDLFKEKSDDPNINFYLGRSAYETKRYHEAVVSYVSVLFEKPDSYRTKFEMARAMIGTESYAESKKLFLEVKTDPKISPSMILIIDKYLEIIDSKTAKHFFSGILMAGVNYDSNINSRSKHDTFSNVYFSSFNTYLDLSNSTQDASAWYNQEIAILNYAYKLDDDMKIKQDFMIFNKDSFSSSYNTTDVVLYSYTPALSVQHNEKLSVDYALYADLMWYGNAKYLKTFALYPKATYIYDEKNTITGYLKYQNKLNQQEANKEKDSIYTELSTSVAHKYDPKLTLIPTVTLINESKKRGTRTDVDYTGVTISLGSNYVYKPTLFFVPSITYTVSMYDDMDTSYLVETENKLLKVALSSTYMYSPKWLFQGSADYTRQSSNVQANEYDKYTFGINVIRPF